MTCFAPALTANLQVPALLARSLVQLSISSRDTEGSEHAKDGCTTSYIQNNPIFEEVFVLVNRVSI